MVQRQSRHLASRIPLRSATALCCLLLLAGLGRPATAQLHEMLVHEMLDSPVKGPPAPDFPGEVLNSAPIVATSPLGIAHNLADGELKVLDLFDGNIYRFDLDLNFEGSFSHALAGFTASGLAYDDDRGNYYLMNGTTGQLQEADPSGAAVGAPCAVPGAGLPAGVAYDPRGTDDTPSLWFIDIVEDTVYEISLPPTCAQKSSFLHPLATPGMGVFGNGLDVFKAQDGSCPGSPPPVPFATIDVLGGTVAEGQVTRVVSTNDQGIESLPQTDLTGTGDNFLNDLVRVEVGLFEQVFFVVGNGTETLFEVEAEPVLIAVPICEPEPIPAVGSLGLLVLVLTLGGAAVVVLVRRKP